MAMRISLKLTMAFLIVLSAVLSVTSYLRIKRESTVFEIDMKGDHETMGRDLSTAVARIWEWDGQAAALRFIEEANGNKGRISIRWTQPDVAPDSPFHPTVPTVARAAFQKDRDV